jgi:tetratricopeptide (TPR) repeat protein
MRLKAVIFLTFGILLSQPAGMVAQERPGNFSELAARASSAREQGNLSEAINLYGQAVQLDPKWPDGWWYLGSLEYATNAYAPAIDSLSHYIGLMPSAGPAFALRGLSEFEEGEDLQALQDLQTGVELGAANQPKNSTIILYHQALLLTRLGRFEEALGTYAVLLKNGAQDEDITTGIGLAGLRMAILPKNIEPAQKSLILKVGAAAAHVMNGDSPGGNTAFEEIFDQFPQMPNLHYLYGYLLMPTLPQQAIIEFNRELAVSPSSAIAHSMLAWDMETQGDFSAALPNAEKAVAEDSSLLIGQLVLGRGLVETGNAAAGLPHLELVLKAEPKNLEAHLALAKAYSELGRKDDARQERLLCLSFSNHGAANANL